MAFYYSYVRRGLFCSKSFLVKLHPIHRRQAGSQSDIEGRNKLMILIKISMHEKRWSPMVIVMPKEELYNEGRMMQLSQSVWTSGERKIMERQRG